MIRVVHQPHRQPQTSTLWPHPTHPLPSWRDPGTLVWEQRTTHGGYVVLAAHWYTTPSAGTP